MDRRLPAIVLMILLIVLLLVPWGWAQRDQQVDGTMETTRWTLFSWGHSDEDGIHVGTTPDGVLPARGLLAAGMLLIAAACASATMILRGPRWLPIVLAGVGALFALASIEFAGVLGGVMEVCGPGRMSGSGGEVTYRCAADSNGVSNWAAAVAVVACAAAWWARPRPPVADGPMPALPE